MINSLPHILAHSGKKMSTGKRLCLFFFTITLIGMSLSAVAQEPTRSALKSQIAHIAEQINGLQSEQNQLLRKNKVLTDKISRTKLKLQKGGNRLIELQLLPDLSASRELADQIQALDKRIYGLTEQSVTQKKQLVGVLNTEIERLGREADVMESAKVKTRRLELILRLQKEKETYQTQIRAESNELLLGLEISLSETDGPYEIQQKRAIVFDQRDILQTKIAQLDSIIKETKKKLSLQQSMLELLRDIRRGEDDEFDLDRNLRIAELQEDIADIEATLEIMRAKQESWHAKEKSLTEKAKRFSQEAEKFTQPIQKGESLDHE